MAEIQSHPVVFEYAPHVAARVRQAMVEPGDLGVDSPELQEVTVASRVKHYEGTPVELYCDGGFAGGVGAVGFCVVDTSGSVLRSVGECHLGFSNNQCECYAVLRALEFVASNRWVR